MDKDLILNILSRVGLFLGLLFSITGVLWGLWYLVAPSVGLPRVGYWTFLGLYILIRGLTTDLTKRRE